MAGNKKYPLNIIIFGTDKASGALGKVSAKLKALDKATGFSRFGLGLKTFGGKMKEAGRHFAEVGAIAAGVSAGLFGVAAKTASVGNEIAKTSKRLGISGEALQKWRYGAELSGVATEDLTAGISFLNRTLGKARIAGKGEVLVYLKKLGISLKDSNGRAKTTEQVFLEAAEAISKIKDPMKRAAAEVALFGKAGSKLDNFLKEGRAGIEAMGAELAKMGLILDEETLARSESFDDNVTRLTMSMKGLGMIVGAALMPPIEKLIVLFTELFTKHQPEIRAFGKALADMIPTADAVARGMEKLSGFMTALFDVLGPVVNALGGPLNVLIGIVGIKLVAGLVAAAQAFIALGAAMLFTPIGQIITGLALVTAAGYMFVKNWDKIKAWFMGLVDTFVNYFVGRFTTIKNFLLGWVDVIMSKLASLKRFLPDWVQKKLGIDVQIQTPPKLGAAALQMPEVEPLRFAGAPPIAAGAPIAPGGAPILPAAAQVPAQESKAEIRVKFENMPRGTRVSGETQGAADLDIEQGYSMVTP